MPGKRGLGSGGWQIQAKIQIYLWLGLIKHKKFYPSGLPPGFKLTDPPLIIVESYDQDKVGKAEFLGRATAKPLVYLEEDVRLSLI